MEDDLPLQVKSFGALAAFGQSLYPLIHVVLDRIELGENVGDSVVAATATRLWSNDISRRLWTLQCGVRRSNVREGQMTRGI